MMPELHVFIDTETTGLGHVAKPPRDDRIIELGIAYRDNHNLIVRRSFLCNPGPEYFKDGYSDEAISVSNIGKKDILAAMPDYEVVMDVSNLFDTLNKQSNLIFHAYNIPFDSVFLKKEPWNFDLNWGIDVMNMAHDFFNLPDDWRISLRRSLELLNIIPQGQPHRADTDAVSTLMLYEEIEKERIKRKNSGRQ